jgi:hypothetical protein
MTPTFPRSGVSGHPGAVQSVVGSHSECHIPIPDVIPMSFMTWKWELLKWS